MLNIEASFRFSACIAGIFSLSLVAIVGVFLAVFIKRRRESHTFASYKRTEIARSENSESLTISEFEKMDEENAPKYILHNTSRARRVYVDVTGILRPRINCVSTSSNKNISHDDRVTSFNAYNV